MAAVGTTQQLARRDSDRALAVCLVFVAVSGATVSSYGLPLIAATSRSLGVSQESAQWVLTIALLTGGLLTPLATRIGDGRRLKLTLVTCLGVVAAGGLVAAAVPGFAALLVGRAMQGVGYALVPLCMAVARHHMRSRAQGITVSILSVSVVVGAGLANPIAGHVMDSSGPRVVFMTGALAATLAAVWAAWQIPSATGASDLSLDVVGAVLITVGLGSGLLAVSRANVWGWTSGTTVGLFVTSMVVTVLAVVHELRTASPLVDLRLVFGRSLLGVNVTALAAGIAIFAGATPIFLMMVAPRETAGGLGMSSARAGAMMLPIAAASLVSTTIARMARRRWHEARVLTIGCVVAAIGFVVFIGWHEQPWQICIVTGLIGFGIGLVYAAMPAVVMAAAPPDRTSSAAGANTVLRIVGAAWGSAVIAAILASSSLANSSYPAMAGYQHAAVFSACWCVVGAFASALMPSTGRTNQYNGKQ